METKKYKLELTDKHCEIINAALDFYSRIGMGQLEEIAHMLSGKIQNLHPDIEETFRLIKEPGLGIPRNGNHGIFSGEISDDFRIAWDIKQVVGYRRAWDENPKGGNTVNFDEPFQSSMNHILPTIERMESDND